MENAVSKIDFLFSTSFFSSSSLLIMKTDRLFFILKFDTGRVKLIVFVPWGANYHFDTAEFSS